MPVRMIFAASLFTGLWLGVARAAEADVPPPPHGPLGPPGFGPGPGLLRDADADKDGRVTHAEVDASIALRFKQADADRSGALDEKEFTAALPKPPDRAKPPDRPKPPEGAPPPDGPPPHMMRFDPAARFRAADWNGDGKLSLDEFAVPLKAVAIQADRNGDGAIDEDELRGPPHVHRGPRPPR